MTRCGLRDRRMESTDLGVPTGTREFIEEKDQRVNGHEEALALCYLFCKKKDFSRSRARREIGRRGLKDAKRE